jgi:predicted ATPase
MFLKRVQVPDFRALKNVDISFEPQFRPRVFPLGSQNGGGKSTLLQLIFVLLHCAIEPERFELIKNLLSDFHVPQDDVSEIGSFDIVDTVDDEGRVVSLKFSCYSVAYFASLLDGNSDYQIQQVHKWFQVGRTVWDAIKTPLTEQYDQEISNYRKDLLKYRNIFTIGKIKSGYVTCEINGLEGESACLEFLEALALETYLAAPSTQVFLFLSVKSRKQLFFNDSDDSNNSYASELKRISKIAPNLFTYDFSSVKLLADAFEKARDDDFRQKAESGEYGGFYDQLRMKMNTLLGDKEIHAQGDLSGIRFSMMRGDYNVDLLPEDLSHGELKRLSIYTWLEHLQIQDAIVLMDEIEIALHPDWQYHIVGDLVEWGPTNQYILATHSYELCQALPPAHVKEIEPNLLPQAQPA